MRLLLLAFLLAGCSGNLTVPPERQTVLAEPAPPPAPLCLVRARFFRGLVAMDCAQLAEMVRP